MCEYRIQELRKFTGTKNEADKKDKGMAEAEVWFGAPEHSNSDDEAHFAVIKTE